MKLIALNLPRDLSEDGLAELFESHGTIASCDLVLDAKTGASKGFGFIEMPQPDEAGQAIKALHGTRIKRNKIRVKPAV